MTLPLSAAKPTGSRAVRSRSTRCRRPGWRQTQWAQGPGEGVKTRPGPMTGGCPAAATRPPTAHGRAGPLSLPSTTGRAGPALPAKEAPGGTACPLPGRSSSLRTPPSLLRSQARDSHWKGNTAAARPAGCGPLSGPGRGQTSPSAPPPPAIACRPAPRALCTNHSPPRAALSANHAPRSDSVPTSCLRATRRRRSGMTCLCAATGQWVTAAARRCAQHPGGCSPFCRARGAERPPPGIVSLRDTRRVPPGVAPRRPGPGSPRGALVAAPAPHPRAWACSPELGLRLGPGLGPSRGRRKGPLEGGTSPSSPGSPRSGAPAPYCGL